MWLQKANTCCERWDVGEDTDVFIGSHDGYSNLPDPLIHRRKLVYEKTKRELIVDDIFECLGPHDIELFWHFAECCQLLVEQGTVVASVSDAVVHMYMPASPARPHLAVGKDDPPLGWISRRFDTKVPSPSIVWADRIHGTTSLITIFKIGESGAAKSMP